MTTASVPRWQKRLSKELARREGFAFLDAEGWRKLLKKRTVTSANQDTLLALDWPHYCAFATLACGGANGWCYTFQGNQATRYHDVHVAMVDTLARRFPAIFADAVADEVMRAVQVGSLPYPNLRYSGSGELAEVHIPALAQVAARGIRLWGFTRNRRVAEGLRQLGVSVILSCDSTSPPTFAQKALAAGFPIAYTSVGVTDTPPAGTFVTFPVHKIGRVREVVDTPSLCPKVVADFLHDGRPYGTCQLTCQRCHAAVAQ